MARAKGEILNTSDFEINEVYTGLRNLVFQLMSSDRSESETQREQTIVAVMMEFARPKAVVTLVAVNDGTASLYFSNGGGVIGAGESESVRMVALDFINVATHAGEVFEPLEQAVSYPLPQQKFVRFYIITSKDISTVEISEEYIMKNTDSLSMLFRKGHELISAIRQHTKS